MKKQFYESKAIWAGALLILYGIAGQFGIVVNPNVIESILTGAGIVGIRDALD